jgi:integrase
VKGSVLKRCTCPPQLSASGSRLTCKKDHGSWYFIADVPGPDGRRKQLKRGGFATRAAAEQALAAALVGAQEGRLVDGGLIKLGVYLDEWLAGKLEAGLRPTTAVSYRQHIQQYIRPRLGNVRLKDLRPAHVEKLLRELAVDDEGRPRSGATLRRVHATLRSALASAVRRRLVPYNAAADVDLPRTQRPKVHPWEPEELGRFLDSLDGHPLAAVFELIAATGLRRGEALGLRWGDVDLDKGILVVRQQLLQVTDQSAHGPCPSCGERHRQAAFGPPKTASGEARSVDLDMGTVAVLTAHRKAQARERRKWAGGYVDHGLVFARPDGNPIPPEAVTKAFVQLSEAVGLRKIRLHDLRHGAASLRLAAGVDIAIVSKQLGHSTIGLTADTYSHLLEGVGRKAAELAMALVPRALRDQPDDSCDQSVTNPASETTPRPRRKDESAGQTGAPPGTRTPNPRIKSPLLCQLS